MSSLDWVLVVLLNGATIVYGFYLSCGVRTTTDCFLVVAHFLGVRLGDSGFLHFSSHVSHGHVHQRRVSRGALRFCC